MRDSAWWPLLALPAKLGCCAVLCCERCRYLIMYFAIMMIALRVLK